MRKTSSRLTGIGLCDRVREEIAQLLRDATESVRRERGVQDAIATAAHWLGWSHHKTRRHYYAENETIAAHDYLHAQQVIAEKRRRVADAEAELEAARKAFFASLRGTAEGVDDAVASSAEPVAGAVADAAEAEGEKR